MIAISSLQLATPVVAASENDLMTDDGMIMGLLL
jgi:hypothetical protein